MPVPYYGSTETLKLMNKNIQATLLAQGGWDDLIDMADSLVSTELEAELSTVFVSWPSPTGEMTNMISVLWALGITEYFQEVYNSTSRNTQSEYAGKQESRYARTLVKVKTGEMLIPGAVRRQSVIPHVFQYTTPRFLPSTGIIPMEYKDQYQHGLRLGAGPYDDRF